jgi:CBS domain-containing protein
MTREVQSCRPDDTLAMAALAMARADCRFLPVVDARGRPVGAITDGDICLLGATDQRRLRELRVRDAMSHRVFTCRPDDDIRSVLRTMRRERIRHLPVVGPGGALEGVVSLTDIVLCAEERQEAFDPICREIAAAVREIAQKHEGGRAVRVHPFMED